MGNLADAYRWSGRAQEAMVTYDKAIALAYNELQVNPRAATTMKHLAQYYAKKAARYGEMSILCNGVICQNEKVNYGGSELRSCQEVGLVRRHEPSAPHDPRWGLL
jgi:hypothetical protein